VEKQDGDYTRPRQDANGVFIFVASFCGQRSSGA
jgi:hypothetical protein